MAPSISIFVPLYIYTLFLGLPSIYLNFGQYPYISITVQIEHSRTATMGEDKKVTTMVLKVDLQCEKCYRKVKKVLCKFPQIRDQTYDEKNNQVTIKVVCSNPEKFRDKLCCKGRCVIKSIEIIKPPPPKPTPPGPVKPPAPEPVKPPAPEPVKPPPAPEPPKPPPSTCTCRPVICRCRPVICRCPPMICTCPPMICTCPPVICTCLPVPPPAPEPPKPPPSTCTCRPVICRCRPVICRCPPMICTCPPIICTCPPVICTCLPVPPPVKCPRPWVNTCCRECSGGHSGGPCQTGYGYGVLCRPYVQFVCYCGRPGYDCYCVTRPHCFSEENPQACAIM